MYKTGVYKRDALVIRITNSYQALPTMNNY